MKKTLKRKMPEMGTPIHEIKWPASVSDKLPEEMNPGELVDQLGKLRKKIAPLNDRYNQYCSELIKRCRKRSKTIDGESYRAAISFIAAGFALDPEKVKKLLTATQIKKCSKPTKPKTVVRVSALKKNGG